MALREQIGMAWRDYRSNDEATKEKPQVVIARLNDSFEQLSATERRKGIDAAKAYATVYFEGKHNTTVPREIQEALGATEKRLGRLNTVDSARVILDSLGGAPTKQTIQDAIERSQQQREVGTKVVNEIARPEQTDRSIARPLRSHEVQVEAEKVAVKQKEFVPGREVTQEAKQQKAVRREQGIGQGV